MNIQIHENDPCISTDPTPSPELELRSASSTCTLTPELKPPTNIDVDANRLILNVERVIISDSEKRKCSVNPFFLLYKSNPGIYSKLLFQAETASGNMLTRKSNNKGDVGIKQVHINASEYNFPILRSKTKASPYDSNIKRMFHRGHRETSDYDISDRNIKTKSRRLGRKFQSHENLQMATSEDKENAVTFPEIKTSRTSDFPLVSERTILPMSIGESKHRKCSSVPNHNTKQFEQQQQKSNSFKKWLAEIPENSKYIHQRSVSNINLDNNRNEMKNDKTVQKPPPELLKTMPHLKPLPDMPNKYLDLRSDSYGRPLKETSINRDKYKLKQKSLLQLKMLDKEEKDMMTRTGQYNFNNRPYTITLGRSIGTHQESRGHVEEFSRLRQQKGDGMKMVDIGEFAVDAYNSNPNDKFNFAKHPILDLGEPSSNTVEGDIDADCPCPSVTEHMSDIPQHLKPYTTHIHTTQASVLNLEIDTATNRSVKRRPFILNHELHADNPNSSRLPLSDRNDKEPLFEEGDGKDESTQDRTVEDLRVFTRSKTILSRINRIDMFGTGRPTPQTPAEKRKKVNAVYKLDLNTVPTGAHKLYDDDAMDIIEPPTLSLEMEKGKVTVTRQPGNSCVKPRDKKPYLSKFKKQKKKPKQPEYQDMFGLSDVQEGIETQRTNVSDRTYTITPDFDAEGVQRNCRSPPSPVAPEHLLSPVISNEDSKEESTDHSNEDLDKSKLKQIHVFERDQITPLTPKMEQLNGLEKRRITPLTPTVQQLHGVERCRIITPSTPANHITVLNETTEDGEETSDNDNGKQLEENNNLNKSRLEFRRQNTRDIATSTSSIISQ